MNVQSNSSIQRKQAIDWKLCLKLANNKEDLANEMLAMFMAELPSTKSTIKKAFQDKKHELLYQHIHKLHGATCYCGFPKLKTLVSDTETALKTGELTALGTRIEAITTELDKIREEYAANSFYKK